MPMSTTAAVAPTDDLDEAKRLRKAARQAAREAAASEEVIADDAEAEAEAERLRKAAKRAAKEAAEASQTLDECAKVQEETAEERRERKAAKRLAKETVTPAESLEATVADEDEEAESRRQRKAAKRDAKEATANAEASVGSVAEEVDEDEMRAQRKAAKRAAKELVAVSEVPEAPLVVENQEHAVKEHENTEVAEAPKAKKSKRGATDTDEAVARAEHDDGSQKPLKVFIKGLPFSKDEHMIRRDFGACGTITDFQLPTDQEGNPKGYAFITYATREGVDAVFKRHNTTYGGRNITVVEDIGKSNKPSDWTCPNCNDEVFGRNAQCRQCGTARPVGTGDEAKGKSKGKEGDWKCHKCSELVFARNSHCRKCGAEKPGGAGADENENTIFMRGLPSSVTEELLQKDFAKYGQILRIKLPLKSGKPNGICFMKFASPEGVEAAMKRTAYGGKTITIVKAEQGGRGRSDDSKGTGKGKPDVTKDKAGRVPTESFSKKTGAIIACTGEKKTFADSDEE